MEETQKTEKQQLRGYNISETMTLLWMCLFKIDDRKELYVLRRRLCLWSSDRLEAKTNIKGTFLLRLSY